MGFGDPKRVRQRPAEEATYKPSSPVDRQTLGPEYRAGFLESPEKCPALSWEDWGEGG